MHHDRANLVLVSVVVEATVVIDTFITRQDFWVRLVFCEVITADAINQLFVVAHFAQLADSHAATVGTEGAVLEGTRLSFDNECLRL